MKVILISLFGLHTCIAQQFPYQCFDEVTCHSDTSIEFAQYKCRDFYDDRRESDFGTTVTYVGEGGQDQSCKIAYPTVSPKTKKF